MLPGDITDQIGVVADRFEKEQDYLRKRPRDQVVNSVLNLFFAAATCTKHPGFREEREWRVVAMPDLIGNKGLVSRDVTLGGVPQQIRIVPLKDVPDEGLFGLNVTSLIEKVIIGPTDVGPVLYGRFWNAMHAEKFPDVGQRLTMSNIPLRVIAGR
jgi:hypothetical protein